MTKQDLPSGNATFLVTDIKGLTQLAQDYVTEMPILLAQHHAINTNPFKSMIFDSCAAAFHILSVLVASGST